MTPNKTLRSLAVALSLLALAACGSSKTSTTSAVTVSGDGSGLAGSASASTAAAASANTAVAAAATTAAPASASASDQAGTSVAAAPNGLGEATPTDRKIATVSSVDMEVKDVGQATVEITAYVEGQGGYVSAQQTSLGANASSTLVVKLLPSKLSGLLNSLNGIGKILARGQQADDVTANYVDLQARIESQRVSVNRMRELYAKASTVEELARAEAELARRETELNQSEGQLRVLNSRVDMSTLTISIHPAPVATTTTVPPTTTTAVPETAGRVFSKSSHALGNFTKAVLYLFLALLPWLVAFAVVGLPLWAIGRRILAKRVPRPVVTARPAGWVTPDQAAQAQAATPPAATDDGTNRPKETAGSAR